MKTNTKNAVEQLQEAGIKVRPYKRPPVDKGIFAISITEDTTNRGTILLNQGRAKIKVATDKSREQAVLTVDEPRRIIKRHIKINAGRHFNAPSLSACRHAFVHAFPVIMPRGTKWDISNFKFTKFKNAAEQLGGTIYAPYWEAEADVTARVGKATAMHFLVGMDETHNFISPLPRRANSVKEAHEMLRPKEIKAKTLRQGEWFFKPCGEITKKRIEKAISEDPRILGNRVLELHSAHSARSAVQLNKKTYARGYIIDRRPGRHKPLFLPDWHEVVRNKEANDRFSAHQKEVALRRRSSWD